MIYHEKRVCQFLEKVPIRSGNTDTCLHISISNVFTFMNSISIYGQLKVWIDIVYGRLRLFGPPVYLRGSGEGRGGDTYMCYKTRTYLRTYTDFPVETRHTMVPVRLSLETSIAGINSKRLESCE